MKKTPGCRHLRHFIVALVAMVSSYGLAATPSRGLAAVPSHAALSTPAVASEASHECFRNHLREAIVLNLERRPLYAALSGGQSKAISDRLVLLERLALVSSHLTNDFDELDRVYRKAGIQVLCEDFMTMAKTPAFKPRFDGRLPRASSFRDYEPSDMKTRLKLALKNDGFTGVKVEAELWLAFLSTEPKLHCMMRHTLESIVRVAILAPRHAEKARKLGLPSPEKLERRLIESHWTVLGQIHRLDRKALPLQVEGLPIICNDVPSLSL
ncbi:MAG: hypothetical protein V4760_07120 [Bdellovibrionota bacterium]